MEIHISLSSSEEGLNFPPVGPAGINGSNSTVFVASPKTAQDFVSYLKSSGVKQIYTGKRGKEYLVGWDGKYIDVAAWKAKGRPASVSAGASLCKHFRVDQGICTRGCPKQGVKVGNPCPFDPDDDDGNNQLDCPCYK